MSELLTKAIAKSEQVNNYLHPVRDQARSRLAASSWPNRKTEAWRYTPLRALEQSWQPSVPSTLSDEALARLDLPQLGSLDLIWLDGHLQAVEGQLPEGLSLSRFSDLSSDHRQSLMQQLGQTKPEHHLFGNINDAMLEDGLWIDVAPNAQITQPIRLVFAATQAMTEVQSRVLVTLGDNAVAHIVEHHLGEVRQWQNQVFELSLGNHARLDHQALYAQQQECLFIGGWHCALGQSAELNSLVLAQGSQLKRINFDVLHRHQHASANLDQMYLLAGKDLFDLHSCIEHEQANGQTNQRVRGLVADQARAVFNGRIHIHQDAQKTAAALNTRTLLLSSQAEVDAKPELEIYADDVRCAHGATVSQLDDQSLNYLRSRGVAKHQAQAMLSLGFMQELVADLKHESARNWLQSYLKQAFWALQE